MNLKEGAQFALEEADKELAPVRGSLVAKAIIMAVAVVVALIMAFPVADVMSSPDTYKDTVASLDKRQVVSTNLMVGTASASVAISMIPDDIGSGIADEMANISGSFAIVLAAILLQKYLMTVVGLIAFRYLIPICIIILALAAILKEGNVFRGYLFTVGMKVLVVCVALSICIPASVGLSDMVEKAYNASNDNKTEQVEEALSLISSSSEEESSDGNILDTALSVLGGVVDTVSGLPAAAQNLLTNVVELFAMMLVLNCLLPIISVLLCLWIANTVLGTNIHIPRGIKGFGSRSRKRMMSAIGKE